ncbi:hypothetical protein ACU8LZ_25725 (plasmid) [Rhizobium leguminosarum]
MSYFRSHKAVLPGCFLLLALAGCGGKDFVEEAESVPVVPIDLVINSLKCGLATAIAEDRLNRSGLQGSKANVTLKANLVRYQGASGDVEVGIPVSTGSVTPKLSGGVDNTLTRNSTLDYIIDLNSSDVSICQQTGSAPRDSGFSAWIKQVIIGINNSVAGTPRASMVKYVYESDFVLKRTGTGGATINIVPVKASLSATASRSDIQNIKIELGAVRRKPGGGTEPTGPGWGLD